MRKAAAMETGTKYKSKIDRAFYIKVLVTLLLGIGLLVFYFIFRNVIVGILGTWMFVALLLIFLPEYRSTYYIIRDNGLLVKNGLFDKVTILYRQMMEVAEEQGAVSYTHLDVYKRQPFPRQRRRLPRFSRPLPRRPGRGPSR